MDDKAAWVKEMFGAIAPRYDVLNRLLSLGTDRVWRRAAVKAIRKRRPRGAAADLLDVCCGTGDLAFEAEARLAGDGRVWGADFAAPMLALARRKGTARGSEARFAQADACRLPFPDARFDAATVAFGIRNVVDWRRGLAEMARVLRPGGVLAVLEFAVPKAPGFAAAFRFYFHRVLPAVGGAVSKSPHEAYRYLPDSVDHFPAPEGLAESLRSLGMKDVEIEPLTGGVAALTTGTKS